MNSNGNLNSYRKNNNHNHIYRRTINLDNLKKKILLSHNLDCNLFDNK